MDEVKRGKFAFDLDRRRIDTACLGHFVGRKRWNSLPISGRECILWVALSPVIILFSFSRVHEPFSRVNRIKFEIYIGSMEKSVQKVIDSLCGCHFSLKYFNGANLALNFLMTCRFSISPDVAFQCIFQLQFTE